MSAVSLALVLVAALLHATWNLLAKRAGEGGVAFVWLFGAMSSALYLPIAAGVVLWGEPELGTDQWLVVGGSALLHTGYFTVLQYGYRVGDLSVVYPLARGTGPLLSTMAAIAFLGERPTALALAGAAIVCVGVVSLAFRPGGRGHVTAGVAFGLLTGGLIAVYTLWDKRAVSTVMVAPILLDWGSNAGRTLLLTPLALRNRAAVRSIWRTHRREALGVAVLAPLAYILVLTALRASPVSYVAPAREVSILFGTIFGARLLGEARMGVRLIGAAAIVVGLTALALG